MGSRAQIPDPIAAPSHLGMGGKGGQEPWEGGALWDWPPGRWEAGFSLLSANPGIVEVGKRLLGVGRILWISPQSPHWNEV